MNDKKSPKVSILLPVYNRKTMVGETLQGILEQTFQDWELLAIDDGSTDGSLDVLKAVDDPRVRVVVNEKNLGLIKTLNRGLDLAQGELIARIDSDDVPLAHWLSKTVEYMDTHPQVVLVSTWAQHYDNPSVIDYRPTDPEQVKATLFVWNCIKHPGAVIRAGVLKEHSLGYRLEYPHAEDYKLWVELNELGQITNLPEVCVRIRYHAGRVTKVYGDTMRSTLWKVQQEQLARLMPDADPKELETHEAFLYKKPTLRFSDALAWRRLLLEKNGCRSPNLFEPDALAWALDNHLLEIYEKRMDRSLKVIFKEKIRKKFKFRASMNNERN